MTLLVAIDGPAGSGKSSVSKKVASQLGFGYLDTGAAYRVLTWHCVEQGVDLADEEAVLAAAQRMAYNSPLEPSEQQHIVGKVDVTEAIRSERVSSSVSQVAAHPAVRALLTRGFQGAVAASALPGILVEGRDITTVVAPDAPVRILLTADESVRIARRERELHGAGKSLSTRDRQDRKVVDFLNAADGVTTVDSTDLSFDETVDAVLSVITPHLDEG